MRRFPIGFVLLLSASCGQAPAGDSSHPAWMVGEWSYGDAAGEVECAHSDFYDRNGYATNLEVGGVEQWRIEGDRLITVIVEPMAGGTPDEVGQVTVRKFERRGPGELHVRSEGLEYWMRRCGDVPEEWTHAPAPGQ